MASTEQILAGIIGGVGRGLSSYVSTRDLMKQRQQEAYEAAMRQRLIELQTQNMEQDIEWQGKAREWETPEREAKAAYYRPEMYGQGKLGIGVPMSQYSIDQQLERQARQQLAEFNMGKQGHEQRMWPAEEASEAALGTQRKASAGASEALAWRRRNQPFTTSRAGGTALKEMTLQQLQQYSSTVQQNIDDLTNTLDYYDPGDPQYESKSQDLQYWQGQADYVRQEVTGRQGGGQAKADPLAVVDSYAPEAAKKILKDKAAFAAYLADAKADGVNPVTATARLKKRAGVK